MGWQTASEPARQKPRQPRGENISHVVSPVWLLFRVCCSRLNFKGAYSPLDSILGKVTWHTETKALWVFQEASGGKAVHHLCTPTSPNISRGQWWTQTNYVVLINVGNRWEAKLRLTAAVYFGNEWVSTNVNVWRAIGQLVIKCTLGCLCASHKVQEGKDEKRCGGSQKSQTVVWNLTTTLFVWTWLHCTQQIHLPIHWNFKNKSFNSVLVCANCSAWILKVTLKRGFHVRSRCLNVSGTLDFFWPTFSSCDDWLGCFWARKSQNIRVLWWETHERKNLCPELLQRWQTCIAHTWRMFWNRQDKFEFETNPQSLQSFMTPSVCLVSRNWDRLFYHMVKIIDDRVVNVHIFIINYMN